MNTHADKASENKSQAVANSLPKLQSNGEPTFQFVDNRPEAFAQRKLQEMANNSSRVQQLKEYQEMANNSPQVNQLKVYQAMANNFTSQIIQPKENSEEAVQGKFEPIQKKENNTGLPDNLKSGVENLSGYSLDDVKVHYNSDKPAQLQAHAYAQGTDIHIASGQETHLPHEAWHVVQQKQGRVKPTLQMKGGLNVNDDAGLEKEADVMGGIALSSAEGKTSETVEAAASSKTVFQRQIIINDEKEDKDKILDLDADEKEDKDKILDLDAVVKATYGRIHLWLTKKGMTATLKGNVQDVKAEITASESNAKADRYLVPKLPGLVSPLLAKYDTENRTFENKAHLYSQVIQDVKLSILQLDDIVGIEHNNGQFSTTDKSGREKPLRLYRTTTRTDWNTYLTSNNIAGLLHGHGGALGQALDYFYKSRNSAKDGPLYDNVIFEIKFTEKASAAIDYDKVSSGGEGGGPKGGKLTGKSEKNDILGEEDIFSVNLAACSELIMTMNPTIRRVDEMKGEDTQYSKRYLELAIKHGEYPPRNLTEAERTELEGLRGH